MLNSIQNHNTGVSWALSSKQEKTKQNKNNTKIPEKKKKLSCKATVGKLKCYDTFELPSQVIKSGAWYVGVEVMRILGLLLLYFEK